MKRLSDLFLSLTAVTFLVLFILCFNVKAETNVGGIEYNIAAAYTIEEMFNDNYLVSRNYADYYVKPIVWLYLDYNAKKNLIIYCAHHYVSKGGGALRSVLYDSQTGKKLGATAVFSSSGVKIY